MESLSNNSIDVPAEKLPRATEVLLTASEATILEVQNLSSGKTFESDYFPEVSQPIQNLMQISNGIRASILPELELDITSSEDLDRITLNLYNLWRDAQFSIGFRKMLEQKIQNPQHTYFIADIGSPHCVSVALAMMSKDISCNFVFHKDVSPRLRDVMLLVGDELMKRNPNGEQGPMATLIDCHRDEVFKSKEKQYKVSPDDFPSPDDLKRRGITQICLFKEVETGRDFHNYEYASDQNQVLNTYRANGIEVVTVGIDEVWAYNAQQGAGADRELFASSTQMQAVFKSALVDIIRDGNRKQLCDLLAGLNVASIQ